MSESEPFVPDWASAPGETVGDLLRERNMSIQDFAKSLEMGQVEANALLSGHAPLTDSVAQRLGRCFGGSESFWKNRELQYRADQERVRRSEQDWLDNMPVPDMIRFGWIEPLSERGERLQACHKFFGVPDVSEWNARYRPLLESASFRISPAFDARMASVAAWLRQGEIEAQVINCQSWDPERFEFHLGRARALTRDKDPHRFVPQLQSICADAGVAVVVVRAPDKCPTSGATWFSSAEKAILQLSFRFLTDDHFWFTFFHEAGHLLLHTEKMSRSPAFEQGFRWILEDLDSENSATIEVEANEFAYHTLIPEETEHSLINLRPGRREVMRYARQIGVSPGIVVGQLQHAGRLRHNQLNSLKRRYEWYQENDVSRRTS